MKKSIILFELLITIILFSILSIYSLNFSLELFIQNQKNFQQNIQKIDLENLKIFIQRKLINNEFSLQDLSLDKSNLYYENSLLQDDISLFDITQNNGLFTINVCIKKSDQMCSKWILNEN